MGYWPQEGEPARERFGSIAGLWALPLVAAVFLTPMMVQDLGPAWSAAHGGGVHGTLHVESSECAGRGPCQPIGTFTADDGAFVLQDVRMTVASLRTPRVGSDVRVTYQGGRDPQVVYRADSPRDWIFLTAVLGFAVLCALWCVACLAKGAVWVAGRTGRASSDEQGEPS